METKSKWEVERDAIREAIAQLPTYFRLHHVPNKVFRMSESASYFSDGELVLYCEVRTASGEWLDYSKGSLYEFQRYAVPVTEQGQDIPNTSQEAR